MWQRAQKDREQKYGRTIFLPEDFSYSIPKEPLEWVKQYGITEREIIRSRMGWSSGHGGGLIFPVFDVYGNLLLYQRRKFNPKGFHTEGRPELVDHIIGCEGEGGDYASETLVLVEDFISQLKVSRHRATLCLWGSSLHDSRIRRLARCSKRLVIWLDFDKKAYATKRKIAAEPFYDSVRVVITQQDPKAMSDEEIELELQG
jgi:hypothetical protein